MAFILWIVYIYLVVLRSATQLKLGLIRHVESQYNFDANKLLANHQFKIEEAEHGKKHSIYEFVEKHGTAAGNWALEKAGKLAHTGDKDSPVSANGLSQLQTLYKVYFVYMSLSYVFYNFWIYIKGFGTQAIKELGEEMKKPGYKIQFETSDLRRAFWTMIAAMKSMINAAPSSEEFKKSLGAAHIVQYLRESIDAIHRDSKSDYQKAWRQDDYPFKDASAKMSFLEYLAEGLPPGTALLPTMGASIDFVKGIDDINWKYEGLEDNKNGRINNLNVERRINGYIHHLWEAMFKQKVNAIIVGAHSKWIREFVKNKEIGGDAIYDQYKKLADKDEKVPNGAVLWMTLELDKINHVKIVSNSLKIVPKVEKSALAKETNYGDLEEEYYEFMGYLYDDGHFEEYNYDDMEEYDDLYDNEYIEMEDDDENDDDVWTYLNWFG